MTYQKLKYRFTTPFVYSLILMALSITHAQGMGKGGRKVVIQPQSVRLEKGEQVQFGAKIVEKNGIAIDTTFIWSVDANGFGEISDQGLFTTLECGRGHIYASVGNLTGRSHVTVNDTALCDSIHGVWNYLEIAPKDTLILLGETIQFRASLMDTAGVAHDTTASWELRGNTVGDITDTGFFTANRKGVGLVCATLGRFSATTRIIVATETDTASCDSIGICFRDRGGKQQGDWLRIGENSVFLFKGLKFPLNILNGGGIVFPPGSLTEDIDIEINLSKAAIVLGDSTLSYFDQILTGVSFDVTVNGIIVSPYYFTEPVQLVLPYKEDLMNLLGLNPEDLWIFFYENNSDYNGDGITNVVVDTVMNKIYADVIHFSDLVVGARTLGSTAVDGDRLPLPEQHRLNANYPNPFNPETRIAFELAGINPVRTVVTVHNVRGQKVRTLLDASTSPGNHVVIWNGRNDHGEELASGLYLCRLKAGMSTLTRRMLLLK